MSSNPVAIHDAAVGHLNAGRVLLAVRLFREVIQLQPRGPSAATAYFNLGIGLKDLGRHHDSAVAYFSALSLQPAFPQAHFNLARCFQLLADDGGPGGYLRSPAATRRHILLRAAHHFRRSASGDGISLDTYRSLEEVLHQLGEEDAARRAYAELLRRAPHEGLRQRRRVHCERMRSHLAQLDRENGWEWRGRVDGSDVPFGSGASQLPPASICSPALPRSTAAAATAVRGAFAADGYVELPPLLAAEARTYALRYYERLARRAGGGFYRDEPSLRDREHDSILAKDRYALDNDVLGLFFAERLTGIVEDVTGIAVVPGRRVARSNAGAAAQPARLPHTLPPHTLPLALLGWGAF